MAIARAICKCSTCGKEFEVRVERRNRRDADDFEDWAERNLDECPDCRGERVKKEHDAENAAAAEAAEKMGLPTLEGSEKQVAWATTIRQKCIDELDEAVDDYAEVLKIEDKKTAQLKRFVAWLAQRRRASWWIDNRSMTRKSDPKDRLRSMVSLFGNEFLEQDEEPEEKEAREAAQEEMTVRPVEKTHPGAVEILVTSGEVLAKYQKDADFREVVKGMKYRWDGEKKAWAKKIGVKTGAAEERAAELGNRLLNAGFAIRIADEETRQRAVSGDYEPEHERWITKDADSGKFAIWWERGNDDLYQRARGIHGAKYKDGRVLVPAEAWDEVDEFAAMNDFHISPGAQEVIDGQRAATETVAPAYVPKAQYADTEADMKDILNSSRDVLEDLKEED